MKTRTGLMSLLFVALIAPAIAQDAGKQVTAFVNVNVIPMDREHVLKDQTVVVRDGRIAELGPAKKVKVPAGALRVNGLGKFLIPGLFDMHTHLFSDGKFPDSLAGDELKIMLANGVTTIRLMIGTPEHLKMRAQVAKGELLGPTMYVASPELAGRSYGDPFNGYVVTTPDEARAAVRRAKADGYDFIKLTIDISRPVYDAVIEAARESGIRVVGHVDLRVGLQRALEAGQQIEHLDSYMEAVLKDDSPMKVSVSDSGVWRKARWESLDYVDERKVAEVSLATARAGIYTCPTLTFFKLSFAVEQSDEEIRARSDYRFFPPELLKSRHAARQRFWTSPPSLERREKYIRIRNQMVKGIHDAGGKIMAGSDTPELFLLYGFTLHRELKNLVEAGLTPYAALGAATRVPAEFLNALDEAGVIGRGKRADLVLLESNPLEDISNTEKRAGVMARGRWMPESELKKTLDEIAPRFQAVSGAER